MLMPITQNRRLNLVVCLAALSLLIGAAPVFAQGGDPTSFSPESCTECHAEAYDAWAASGHNTMAFAGEPFQAEWNHEDNAGECLACHATGYDAATGDVAHEAVTCGACHPYDERSNGAGEERDHPKMVVASRSRACEGCHGEDHALSYGEWEQSAHNDDIIVECTTCHDVHSGGLQAEDVTTLCGSCHFQPLPTNSNHMDIDSGCEDCHPSEVSVDNVHMQGGAAANAVCTDCHMVQEVDRHERVVNTGHSMDVTLTACLSCHGDLHAMQPSD